MPAHLVESLNDSPWELIVQQHAESVVTLALGERAALVRTVSTELLGPPSRRQMRWVVGIHLQAGLAEKTVEKGPAVGGEESEVTEFRLFWGSRAEVRRMKDGSIIEAVVWSDCTPPEKRHHLVATILRHALSQHLGGLAEVGTSITVAATDGRELDPVLYRNRRSERQWKCAMDTFGKLAKRIRGCRGDGGASGLPLAVTRVVATSARLRRCSALPPRPHPLVGGCEEGRERAEPSLSCRPMGVVLEFESSGSWPSDDMMALRAIKCAMLLRLSETLSQRYGLYSSPTKNFLDVFFEGYAFRLTIAHSRELSLIEEDIATLERVAKATEAQRPYLLARVPRGLTQAALPALRAELASIQCASVLLPLHASSVGAMVVKHAPVSQTLRLAKCWCAAHMFSGQIAPQAIELLVCYCFTERGAAPYAVPVSHIQGFLRFLLVLVYHDWKRTPLVVDLDADVPLMAVDVETAWEARRASSIEAGNIQLALSPYHTAQCHSNTSTALIFLRRW